MFTVKTFACADTVIQDLTSRRVSLINLLEEIVAGSFPVFLPRLGAVALLDWNGQGEAKASGQLFVYNNDQQLTTAPFNLRLREGARHQIVWNFQGIPISSPGIFRLELKSGDTQIAVFQVNVRLEKIPKIQVQHSNGDPLPSEKEAS